MLMQEPSSLITDSSSPPGNSSLDRESSVSLVRCLCANQTVLLVNCEFVYCLRSTASSQRLVFICLWQLQPTTNASASLFQDPASCKRGRISQCAGGALTLRFVFDLAISGFFLLVLSPMFRMNAAISTSMMRVCMCCCA